MFSTIELVGQTVLNITSLLGTPFVYLESFLLSTFGIEPSTSFRMLLPCETSSFSGLQYVFALLLLAQIPKWVAQDERQETGSILNMLLGPLLARTGRPMAYVIRFARAWLYAALVNSSSTDMVSVLLARPNVDFAVLYETDQRVVAAVGKAILSLIIL